MISSSLKTLGKVLRAARPEFITELFSSDTGMEDTTRKRVRLDSDASCEDVPQVMSIKVTNCEKLAFVLFRRLRDSRWEVRDSILEFIASLLLINNGECFGTSGHSNDISTCIFSQLFLYIRMVQVRRICFNIKTFYL